MQPNLTKELRRAADSLLESIQRQSPEITGIPRRIQVVYEAADELEKQQIQLDAALSDMKDLAKWQEPCEICKASGHVCADCRCSDNFEWRGPQEEAQS